jgi:hypothetical protein
MLRREGCNVQLVAFSVLRYEYLALHTGAAHDMATV